MTNFAFEANCVVTKDPEGYSHLVVFADQEEETEFYFMLQRSFEHDEQDVRLGMDTFYVEWCGQECSGYGGIERFVLAPGSAEITLDDETAEALDGMQHLTIAFKLTPARHRALSKALHCIFDGTGCFAVARA